MKPLERYHPEVQVGGYTAIDGTVEFYLRVRTLLRPDQVVLDLGAGRAAWVENLSLPPILRELLDLRGDGRRLIGCDVDPIVRTNPLLDEVHVLETGTSPLPFDDRSVDLVVSDWTFEHLSDPAVTAREIIRILKPGGWLCARTPNRNGYISVANRVIPKMLHRAVLRRGQPGRKGEDIFPTVYRANDQSRIREFFGIDCSVTTYVVNPEPSYLGQSRFAWAAVKVGERVLPRQLGAVLLIFARRNE